MRRGRRTPFLQDLCGDGSNPPNPGQDESRSEKSCQTEGLFLSSAPQGPACKGVGSQGWGISIPVHFKLLLLHLPSSARGCVLQDGSVSFQAVHCHRKQLSLHFIIQSEAWQQLYT